MERTCVVLISVRFLDNRTLAPTSHLPRRTHCAFHLVSPSPGPAISQSISQVLPSRSTFTHSSDPHLGPLLSSVTSKGVLPVPTPRLLDLPSRCLWVPGARLRSLKVRSHLLSGRFRRTPTFRPAQTPAVRRSFLSLTTRHSGDPRTLQGGHSGNWNVSISHTSRRMTDVTCHELLKPNRRTPRQKDRPLFHGSTSSFMFPSVLL